MQFDRVVIGTGNAGQAAASTLRQQGRRVAVVDHQPPGGTCAQRGCVPKKVLVAAAETLDVIRRAGAHGISVGPAQLDWPALVARVRTFVEDVPADVAKSLEGQGIPLLRGEARFVGPGAVDVEGERVEANGFVVATGSVPRRLGFAAEAAMWTSDDVLQRPVLPRSVCFVGVGLIAFELGHVLARAGSEVTLVGGHALKAFDADVVERLVTATRDLGIRVVTGARVQDVRGDGPLVVHYEQDGHRHEVEAEVVVNAAGRVPALDGLDLARAAIDLRDRLPVLDTALRSVSNARVAFAGDAAPRTPQLSPVASWEGRFVASHLEDGAERPLDYVPVPRVVYTVPALAQVGLDPVAARRAGIDPVVQDHDLVGWRSARTYAEEHAFARVVLERSTERIVGATLLGHGAQEVIHTFAWAIREGWRAPKLRDAIYAYPTFHADIKYLL
ncbi:MAG: NAD(P)/FAD-dependent oxidoreductase [Myxococcota bacterium]